MVDGWMRGAFLGPLGCISYQIIMRTQVPVSYSQSSLQRVCCIYITNNQELSACEEQCQ